MIIQTIVFIKILEVGTCFSYFWVLQFIIFLKVCIVVRILLVRFCQSKKILNLWFFWNYLFNNFVFRNHIRATEWYFECYLNIHWNFTSCLFVITSCIVNYLKRVDNFSQFTIKQMCLHSANYVLLQTDRDLVGIAGTKCKWWKYKRHISNFNVPLNRSILTCHFSLPHSIRVFNWQ